MSDALFGGKREVSNEVVIKKMKYFIERSKKGMEVYHADRKASLELAKEIRSELQREYKNNDLIRTRKYYRNHELFSNYYAPAVHEALVSVTGVLSYKKLHGFLYDVKDYMRTYLPREYSE